MVQKYLKVLKTSAQFGGRVLPKVILIATRLWGYGHTPGYTPYPLRMHRSAHAQFSNDSLFRNRKLTWRRNTNDNPVGHRSLLRCTRGIGRYTYSLVLNTKKLLRYKNKHRIAKIKLTNIYNLPFKRLLTNNIGSTLNSIFYILFYLTNSFILIPATG